METLLDVLRALADGLVRVGGISDTAHRAMHDVINAHDQGYQDEQAKAAKFSDSDQAELERLLAKQREAEQPAEPGQPASTSPLLSPGTAAE